MRATETTYKTIFDSINDAIFVLDPAGGKILDVNGKMTEMFGYTADEARRMAVGDVSSGIPPYTREGIVEKVKAATEQGGLTFEWHCKDKSGRLFWTEVSLRTAAIDGKTGIVATVRDIPKRKQAERSLKESESRYHSLFENNHAVMLIISPGTGRIVDANPAAVAYYGYSREQITSMTIDEINTLPREKVAREMQQAQSQQQRVFSFRHRLASGEIRDVEIYSGPIVVSGETLLYSIIHDVTERRKAEGALRESEKKYRSLFESSIDGILLTEPDGSIHAANPAACEILGRTEEEIIRAGREGILDTSDPRLKPLLEERERTGMARGELTYKRKDGTLFPVDLSSSITIDSEGHPKASIVFRDISERKQAEQALKTSEERYRTLYSSMAQGVMEFDGEGRLLSTNRAAEEILGLDLHGREGLTLEKMFGEIPGITNARSVTYKVSELSFTHTKLTRNAMKGVKARIRNPKTGEYRWVLMDSIPRLDPAKGALAAIYLIFSDITKLMKVQEEHGMAKVELEHRVKIRTEELQRANELLESQKEALQTIIDHIPVMLTFYNSEGKIRLVNHEFERLLGWSLEEAQDMDIMAAVYPDPGYRHEVWKYMMEALPGWKDIETTTRSGDVLHTSWANVRLSDGSQIGIGIDVSERKRMEQDLLRLFAAIEQTSEGIALASPDGVIEYVNPAYESITGYGRDELIGKKVNAFREYFAGQGPDEILERSVKKGKTWTGRQSRKNRAGELIDIDITVSPVFDGNGGIINLVSVIRDATKEVRLQKQLSQNQKMEAIGALAGGIAHDLKNILTPILINTEMALEDVGAEHPAHPILEEALDAARLGRDLVQQILTFSRRAPRQKVPVNIPAVIRDTMGFLRSTLPSTIDINNDLADQCVMAYADPTQIKQVLINLGTNAGQAMRDHGGILEVTESSTVIDEEEASRISPDLLPGRYIEVNVRDTGMGMDEETIQHIFEPFFTTKKGEGTGMGLAVAHGIVKEHQGAIKVRSTPGKGSLFTVLLPVIESDSADEKCPPPETGR